MKLSPTKLIIVIVIAIVVLLGMVLCGGGIEPNEVLERIEQMTAFTYEAEMTMMDAPAGETNQIDIKTVIAKDTGMRMTVYSEGMISQETFVLTDEELVVRIMPEQKQHASMRLTHDILQKIQSENGDPRALVRHFADNECFALGRSIIDDIKVEGFELNNLNIADDIFIKKATGRLWVDIDSKLPIQLDIEFMGEAGESMKKMLVHDFVWDIEVESSQFEVDIPSDSTLVMDKLELLTEEKLFIEALDIFAELTDGRYPSAPDMETLSREFQEALMAHFENPATAASMSPTLQKLTSLQSSAQSLVTLESRITDLAYYGDTVTAESPRSVLMRWKDNDGVYKVLLGNLSIMKVARAKLEELEAISRNPKPIAIRPYPADGVDAGSATTGLKLTWVSGIDAVAHRVYFGSAPEELSLLAEVTTESAELPPLQRSETYHWRVDEVGADGSVATGEVWSFNSGQFVAHWKLDYDSESTAENSISSDYQGRLVGGPTWTQGIIGGALQFDGINDYVEIVDSNDFAVINQITVCAWIKTDRISRDYRSIITKGDRSWRLQGNLSGNVLHFGCTGLKIAGNSRSSIDGKVSVDDGQWHHVAGVYDGKKISIYIDGQVDHSADASGKINFDDKQIRIGDNSQRPGRYWYGLIDDVRIYSYGMTAQEISALSSQEENP